MLKTHQKGLRFLLKKFNFNPSARVRAAFNSGQSASNWWIIPEVQKRWNKMISGDENCHYESYLTQRFFSDKKDLSLLSIGCGVGNHAIRFAESGHFSRVEGIDLSENLIATANNKVKALGLKNCAFRTHDILSKPVKDQYDVVLFHSSLHHFPDMGKFLEERTLPACKENGVLVLFEFVGPNRHQWTKEQLRASTELLQRIPKKWRKTQLPFYTKYKVRRPGIWRMLLADPSESIDSESILPEVHKRCQVMQETFLGGNLAHLIFKDIAHHFVQMEREQRKIFAEIMESESKFVENQRQSDFIFGVYKRLK
jgi:ubiquinone/menaquinone biosynthesis C-methylase UbiE